MLAGKMILGKGAAYSLDSRKTKRNNNALIVGASGSGKTRGVVEPNLLEAEGSYIITDPKGNLYDKYRTHFIERGYEVFKIDFVRPERSMHYNPFSFIHNSQDIKKIAYLLMHDLPDGHYKQDEFWLEAGQLLLEAFIAYQYETSKYVSMGMISTLINQSEFDDNGLTSANSVDRLFRTHEVKRSDSYAVKQYRKFRVAAARTMKSVLISLGAKIAKYETDELGLMLRSNDIVFKEMGKRKTALFVIVSDIDRSLDAIVNVFLTQAMGELVRYADTECRNSELPVHVRFIMDDFGTNCTILEFPRMIASIRSRGISVMMMLQAESQLKAAYGENDRTIIGNCDTYAYLGGNDLETARHVAERCGCPLSKIMYMPVGREWIFRRGNQPVYTEIIDLDTYEPYTDLLKKYERRDNRE